MVKKKIKIPKQTSKNTHQVCIVPASYHQAWGLPLSMVCIFSETLSKKTSFFFPMRLLSSYRQFLGQRWRFLSPSISALCPIWLRHAQTLGVLPQSLRVYMCIHRAMTRRLLFPWCLVFPLLLTVFLPHLPQREGFDGDTHLGPSVSRSFILLSLCSFECCMLLYLFHLLHEEASLTMAVEDTAL